MNSKTLLIQPIPYDGETAASYLLRAAELNKHSSVYTLIGKENFSYLTKQAHNCELTDLPRFKFALEVLGLDPSYQHLAIARINPTNRSPRRWGKLLVNENLLKLREFSFCPQCLEDQPFFKKVWLFKPLFACPIHSLLLLNKCHQCNEPITLTKGHITLCSSCNADRTKAPRIICKSANLSRWFMKILEVEDEDFFQEFSSYWIALQNFAEFEAPLTDEEYSKITYEYFTDPTNSIKRLSEWINQRIHLAHPRIQLLSFLREREKFDYFDDYLKLVEEKCLAYEISSKSKNFQLLQEEVRLVLNIGQKRLKTLISNDFLKINKEYYSYGDYQSSLVEELLIKKNQFIDYEMFLLPKSQPKEQPIQPSIAEVAAKLDINLETARKLSKTHWLLEDNPSIIKVISYTKLEEFSENFVTASTLARRLLVNPTNLFEKLLSIGIAPVSGPYIDGLPINFYKKSSIENLNQYDITSITNYKTRTGRHKSGTNSLVNEHTYSLMESATKLQISLRAASYLVQAGYLTRNSHFPVSLRIDKSSLDSLKQRIENQDYVSFELAAEILNCSCNWLNQYWCKTGFLTIENIAYWRLIKKSELNKILKLKEKYLTGAEASTILGMKHSHITNLHTQGLIKAYYLGKTDIKIRLFKRVDVLKLKDSSYFND
ncbi:TniQ family protein [Acinetobacter modestus]|uniref:TniQ family protein n=1 Tax=Acinetobacter modestus TaxID=1776740 RepID=UPI001F4AC0A9|nr:TniQ family protein [Acinetobacter modestus]MCH7333988.1 TniQ family protein [Acinetobacter modestus]